MLPLMPAESVTAIGGTTTPALVTVTCTESRFTSIGNSTSISPSAGRGLDSVKMAWTNVTAPARVDLGTTAALSSMLGSSTDPGMVAWSITRP
eukprot:1469158-Rhodomonas_salina.2